MICFGLLSFRTCSSVKRAFLESKFPTLCINLAAALREVEIRTRNRLCHDYKWEPRRWGMNMTGAVKMQNALSFPKKILTLKKGHTCPEFVENITVRNRCQLLGRCSQLKKIVLDCSIRSICRLISLIVLLIIVYIFRLLCCKL